MNKIWQNKKYIAKLATYCTTGIFTLLGFIGLLAPLNEILPKCWNIVAKLFCSTFIVGLTWLSFFIGCSIWFSKKRRITVLELNNNCHVYVQYGDVFSADEVIKPHERRNIVIPVNRCFDTIVDNDCVSERTLHGIAFKRLYSSGKYNEDSLNDALQNDLINRQGLKARVLSKSSKRKGNLKRYEIGAVAEITASDMNEQYFFLALSSFDKDLTAHTSQQEYVLALQRLLEYCNARSQKFPVVIPLIGAGLSRTKVKEKHILEFMVNMIKINKELIHSDIHIIVRENGKDTIAIASL